MRSEVFEFLGSDEATSHIELRIIWSVKNEARRKLDMLNRVKWAIWIHRKQDRKVNGYREKPDSRISSRTFFRTLRRDNGARRVDFEVGFLILRYSESAIANYGFALGFAREWMHHEL